MKIPFPLFCTSMTLLLGTLVSCGGSTPIGGSPEIPKIHTTAQAERKVNPNMAKITFAVMTRANNANKAREDNAAKMTALVEKLKDMKVPEDDVQTVDYRIQEIFSYTGSVQKVDSYEVVNRIQMRVLDVKNVGNMIDQLVPLGANKIESIEFDVAEKDEIYKELLEEATSVAREKASRMAEAANLGKITVIEVREEMGFQQPPPYQRYAMAESKASGDVSTQIVGAAILKASVALTAKARE